MNELLQPGFPGVLTLDEGEFIRQKIERSSRLKRIWGIKGKVTLPKIAAVAYPEDEAEAKVIIRREMSRAGHQNARKRKNSHKIVAGKNGDY